jgi:hypothetical protein
MRFNSLPYLVFLSVAVALYWIMPNHFGCAFVLLASLVFTRPGELFLSGFRSWLPGSNYGIEVLTQRARFGPGKAERSAGCLHFVDNRHDTHNSSSIPPSCFSSRPETVTTSQGPLPCNAEKNTKIIMKSHSSTSW